VALGAEVNLPTKAAASLQLHGYRLNMLGWTVKTLAECESTQSAKSSAVVPKTEPATPAADTWNAYRAYCTVVLPTLRPATGDMAERTMALFHLPNSSSDPKGLERTKEYFEGVKSLLVAHGAVHLPLDDKLPPLPSQPSPSPLPSGLMRGMGTSGPMLGGSSIVSQTSGYVRHTKHSTESVPLHLKAQYDELYEACWTGDNARIQELCLPKTVLASESPIQISVQTSPPGLPSTIRPEYTPLFVALYRRHWETARLVLAIAAAQYKPKGEEKEFSVDDLVHDDDSDSDMSTDDDPEVDAPINFTDIAVRPSAIHCEVAPLRMLEQAYASWISKDGKKYHLCAPLYRAIIEDDFEMFVKCCDLYKSIGHPLSPQTIVQQIMQDDRQDMLDELIRRTGCGVSVALDVQQKQAAKKDPEETIYLGLNVGGKKRRDLVAPHAPRRTVLSSPRLLLEAAKAGALGVLDYLSGPRPLAAYKYYASSQSDERALYLRRQTNLEAVLPQWHGWQIDELNESCLTAAILANKFECVKKLFALRPNLMMEAMNVRIKFNGFNALLLAAYVSCDTDIVDFFLNKGCDPSERDARGWNIYHVACASAAMRRRVFLDHLLKKLPADLTHVLLGQQSKGAGNTPIMLATKRGNSASLRSMLEFGVEPSILLLKDEKGSIPLHVAVQEQSPAMTELLIRHTPLEGLYMENGVGQNAPRHRFPAVSEQHQSGLGNVTFPLDRQEVQVPKLRATLDALLRDGQLKRATKVANALLAFADRMEGKLAAAQAAKKAEEDSGNFDPTIPTANVNRTYALVRDAVASRPGARHLVHLLDVQKSVQLNLKPFKTEMHVGLAFERTLRETDGLGTEVVVQDDVDATPTSQLTRYSVQSGYRQRPWTAAANVFGADVL
ncbi:hypothetical protein EW146_g3245, partial [Bondarzewia mesenterica]